MQPVMLVAELTQSGVEIVYRKPESSGIVQRFLQWLRKSDESSQRGTPYTERCRKEEIGARAAHQLQGGEDLAGWLGTAIMREAMRASVALAGIRAKISIRFCA